MTPYERAQLIYLQERCARSFTQDVVLHLRNGYVFSTPKMFLMGRGVLKNAPYSLVTDPSVTFDEPDSWLVYLAVGDISDFFRYEPYPLRWIGFERENVLRFHSRNKIKRIINLCHTMN